LKSEELKNIFSRFLQNNYSAEDLRAIQDHFNQEQNKELLITLIEAELNSDIIQENEERVNQILQRTDAAILSKVQEKQKKRAPLFSSNFYKIASAAVLVIGGFIYFLVHNNEPIKQLTVSVPYGKIIRLTLPDSSKLWLNAGTTLEYPEKFSGATRNIRLKTGQIYLEIKHDETKPFVISTKGVGVTVLGTTFDVKSFEGENTTVTVASGKVGVLPHGGESILLNPNEQAEYDINSKIIGKKTVSASDIISWRNRNLIFKDQSLGEVLSTLERRFDVEIEIKNKSLLSETVNIRLADESLEDVLNVLSFSNHFKYEQNGRLIIIK